MIKVRYKNSPSAVSKRMHRLPSLGERVFISFQKRNADRMIKNFKNGIKRNALGLQSLADGTIKRKRALGYERPETPLYGAGDSASNRSLINCLMVRKLKNGYKVYPSRRLHHSGKLSLEKLLGIHEDGAVIKRTKKDGSSYLIKIPPRKAFTIASEVTLKQISLEDPSQKIKRAITQLITTGSDSKLRELARKL